MLEVKSGALLTRGGEHNGPALLRNLSKLKKLTQAPMHLGMSSQRLLWQHHPVTRQAGGGKTGSKKKRRAPRLKYLNYIKPIGQLIMFNLLLKL